jgi:hypothetical protein
MRLRSPEGPQMASSLDSRRRSALRDLKVAPSLPFILQPTLCYPASSQVAGFRNWRSYGLS